MRTLDELRMLDESEVEAAVKLKSPTFRKMSDRGEFPKPVRLRGNRIGWVAHEIAEWLSAVAAKRDEQSEIAKKPGLVEFWRQVRAGERQHPRTAGRLRKMAAQQAREAA